MPPEVPPPPWHDFFVEVEAALPAPVEIHCLGGFVLSMLYGMPRPTGDVDFLWAVPDAQISFLVGRAGKGSRLHKLHGVYLQHVGIATLPENYQERLVEMFPAVYRMLRFLGLDPYDLALSKLERNLARDREDVKYLVRSVPLDPGVLERRYREELRPHLANVERHDLTMQLWLEMLHGEGQRRST